MGQGGAPLLLTSVASFLFLQAPGSDAELSPLGSPKEGELFF